MPVMIFFFFGSDSTNKNLYSKKFHLRANQPAMSIIPTSFATFFYQHLYLLCHAFIPRYTAVLVPDKFKTKPP